MPYNDVIIWPTGYDVDWPNLANNDTSVVSDNERFYAEHYNKLRNFIVAAYNTVKNTTTAASDQSFQKISAPITFLVNLDQVINYVAFDASLDSNVKIPGNVLPFEFVISTNTTDNYGVQIVRTDYDFLIQDTSAHVTSKFGTVSPLSNKVLVSAELVGNSDYKFDTSFAFPTQSRVVCSASVGTDTLLIQGAIIDNRINASSAELGLGVDRWKAVSSQTPFLKVSLLAVI